MAENTIILVNGPDSIQGLVLHLGQIVGHSFVKNDDVEWNLYTTSSFGVHFCVYDDHGFENDLNIEYERFAFAIDMKLQNEMNTNMYSDDWSSLCSLRIGSILSGQFDCECMVVENMQRIVKLFLPSKH